MQNLKKEFVVDNPNMKELFERIRWCSKNDRASNTEYMIYLAEELGEIAACLSVEAGFKKKDLDEPTSSECVDRSLSGLGLMLRYDITYEDYLQMLEAKIQKWEKSIHERHLSNPT